MMTKVVVLKRTELIHRINRLFRQFAVVTLLGPRQCGKTTVARPFAPTVENFFDLESPAFLARLRTSPEYVLGRLKGVVVLDEIQTQPRLFPILRVLADRPGRPARFLLLGSASPDLQKETTETLAGRTATIEMTGFQLGEVAAAQRKKPGAVMNRLWLRGGSPPSYLARNDAQSYTWREHFMQTFLTRDLPQLGITIPAPQMRRFWMMIAHYHGQSWNASEIGGSLGLSDKTVRSYLDILTGSFMVRQLLPWTENVGKRIRKAPKIYIRDSGMFHTLMSLPTMAAVESHPKLGASWEGFALEQVIQCAGLRSDEVFYWGTHSGAELDLLTFQKGKRVGYEFKFSDGPELTKSMRQASSDLKLDSLKVVYPGAHRYPLADGIEAVPLADLT
jgi:predicted AAA+ superfamily ATPase